jgi:hypothetical protein
MITPTNIRAVYKLYPQVAHTTDTTAYDASGNEVAIDFALIDAEVASTQYQRQRMAEYPSIQEQMDMQYWDAINGTTTWQDAINAVKQKFPKGA